MESRPQLSIVVLCWNDSKVILDCLKSIYSNTHGTTLEVIVSDNGSTDGSQQLIRQEFPSVVLLENGSNLGFARGNNAGIHICRGRYVLILNPDTIIHEGALDKLVSYADLHPQGGAFGCRVLNPNGSYQISARPFPTIWRSWLAALYLRPLAYISDVFIADSYTGWNGDTERPIDWQSGCCVMVRADLLKGFGGFDEQFFYHFEEVDLCRRVWNAKYQVLYTPDAQITHLGGQSVNRFPIRFALEKYRNRYRYFYKHFGKTGAMRCRQTILAWLWLRRLGYGLKYVIAPSSAVKDRLAMYRTTALWNYNIDPVRFVETGEEPIVLQDPALQTS